MCTCHHVLACLLISRSPSLAFVCVSLPALQLCGTSCACLLYLVNLLQESRLPAEAPSLRITPVSPCIIARRTACLPQKTHTGCTAGSSATEVVLCFVCMSGHLFHVCKALSDQSCLLTVPASIAWNTCSRRASCKHHNSGTQSALKDSNSLRIRNKLWGMPDKGFC